MAAGALAVGMVPLYTIHVPYCGMVLLYMQRCSRSGAVRRVVLPGVNWNRQYDVIVPKALST